MKERFMNRLESYLSTLSEEERREILDFYEERFHTGKLYEGKSEEEIVSELEAPEDIARNVLREYGKPFDARAHYNTGGDGSLRIGSLVGVVLFDVFVVSWFVPALFSVIVAFIAALGAVAVSLVVTPLTTGEGSVAILLVGAGLLFFGVLLVLWLYDMLVSFIAWLLEWHLNALRLGFKDWPRQIRKLRVQHFLKKRPGTNKLKNKLKFIALLLVVAGGAYQLVNYNTLSFSTGSRALENETTEETVSDFQGWDVSGSMDVGDVTFHTHELDSIRVESNLPEEADVTIAIDEETRTLTLDNDLSLFSFNIGNLFHVFSDDMYVDVYLPEDLELSQVDIEQLNGDILIKNHALDGLDIRSVNGDVSAENIISDSPLHLATTNGNVSVLSSTAAELNTSSSNGRIDIRQGTFDDLDVSTTNGKIVIQNINDADATDTVLRAKTTNGNIEFSNVYVNTVTMESTNGSLTYENDDTDFEVGSLDYSTTNGRTTIRVPYSN